MACLLLGSCTSTVTDIDTAAQNAGPQFNATASSPETQGPAPVSDTLAPAPAAARATAAIPENQTAVLTEVAAQPAPETQAQLTAAATGEAGDPAPVIPARAEAPAAPAQVAALETETVASPAPLVVVNEQNQPAAPAAVKAPLPQDPGTPAKAEASDDTANAASLVSAAPSLTAAEPQPAATTARKPKKTLFAAMFGDTQQKKSPAAAAATELAKPAPTELALAAAPAARPNVAKAAATELDASQLRLTQASLSAAVSEGPVSAPAVDNGDLPGVRKGALFEIKRRDSLDSDADIDIGETDDGPVLLASAGGFARLAPNGLKVQRQSVDVACLKPQLVRMLKKIEAHYNTSVIVTSGYRSPNYNRRLRGAKNSLHMYCAAADIQVVGVGKWELARYLRSMPGRGGVGTYCHTDSIHVDIGPDRDWNWRCSRRK